MSDYEEDFEKKRNHSLSMSNDSIEEYIGDFEDVSKPGQRQLVFNKQPVRQNEKISDKDFKRLNKIETSKMFVAKSPEEIRH